MKKTLKIITGWITFLSAITGLLSLFFILFMKQGFRDREEQLVWLASLMVMVSAIYYSVTSRFWTARPSSIDSLENEIEIAKKKIEKKELIIKLEMLEKNQKSIE